jgi:peptidoglycan-N-acetylmuramic acid deacetylase
MIDEGHIVGNHSANHYDLSTLSTDRVVSEIMNLHNYVLENYNYEMTYFRPPSGYFSERVLAIAQSLGYTTLQYSFAYVDWEVDNQPNPAAALQKMVNSLYNGTIYQFHTVSSTNAQVLGAFIDAAREKGMEIALFD